MYFYDKSSPKESQDFCQFALVVNRGLGALFLPSTFESDSEKQWNNLGPSDMF